MTPRRLLASTALITLAAAPAAAHLGGHDHLAWTSLAGHLLGIDHVLVALLAAIAAGLVARAALRRRSRQLVRVARKDDRR